MAILGWTQETETTFTYKMNHPFPGLDNNLLQKPFVGCGWYFVGKIF
jgi:hypothetical protein